MFIDVLIGLFLIYFLFCVVCSALMELLSTALSLRAYTRKQWVIRLFGSKELAEKFYEIPIIRSLGNDGNVVTRRLNWIFKRVFKVKVYGNPSYIPPKIFAKALVDFVRKENVVEVAEILESLDGDVDKVAEWFDEAMRRVSGWYKRKAQVGILLIALILAISFNLDTVELIERLSTNAKLTTALVSSAESLVRNGTATIPPMKFGWKEWDPSLGFWDNLGGYVRAMVEGLRNPMKVAGILTTAIATVFGAPFWYDVLGRFVRLRSVGERPKRTEEW